MAEGSKSGIFVFDQFRLDGDKLMLYRDGVEVSIPPKVAKTLAVLVESAGTIISKEEVIERVWDDAIVEESNLTQYLYLLRKVLGTMPDGRPYIETLRRRGYRFNGNVERLTEERPAPKPVVSQPQPQLHTEPEPLPQFGGVERDGNVLRVVDWKASEPVVAQTEEPLPQASVQTPDRPPKSWLRQLGVAAVILLLLGAGGFFFWPKLMPAATNAESQGEILVTKLTNGVLPHGATISPDGNVFVYHETQDEVCRMFVQQTGQAARTEITSSTSHIYSAKTFAHDGQTIFYTGVEKKALVGSVYRIPTMGGSPVKILDDIHGAISLSPDGKEMTFTRRNPKTGETAILIAGIDGKGERILLQRPTPNILLPSPAWSPDGKIIVYGDRDAYDGRVMGTHRIHLLNVATGKSTSLSHENWDGVTRFMWAPDGRGIFLIGTREGEGYSTRRDQVYFVSYPEGVSRRLTNEGNRHEPDSLGVTRKGDVISVSSNRSSQMWVMDANGNANSAVQITRGAADGRAGMGLLPDGRFGYLTRNADEIQIMLANADGSGAKQIATGFQFIEELRADPLGRFFVFSSLKDGKNRMFRIDVDGGNLKQLTFGDGYSIDSSISPDGKYLAYDNVIDGNDPKSTSVMRVPVDGGQPVLLKKGCFIPTYSPDGSMLTCVSNVNYEMVIISSSDGAEVDSHPIPLNALWNFGWGWLPDGSGLVYIDNNKGPSNLWVQPRDKSKPRQITNFTSGIIYRYAFSPDGSKIYLARGYPTHDAFLIKNFR